LIPLQYDEKKVVLFAKSKFGPLENYEGRYTAVWYKRNTTDVS
jgi:hypothetical protein